MIYFECPDCGQNVYIDPTKKPENTNRRKTILSGDGGRYLKNIKKSKRKHLSKAVLSLFDEHGWTYDEIATAFGMSSRHITEILKQDVGKDG